MSIVYKVFQGSRIMIPSILTQRLGDLASKIGKTDDDGIVQIYSYVECEQNSPEELKQCRGLVFAGENMVLRSFGFTPEYNETQVETIESSVSNYRFFEAEEGCLLRMFYVEQNQKWYLATHRKLDAFKSRWSNDQSFGDMFLDALAEIVSGINRDDLLTYLTDRLDKSQAYFFLVRNTKDNRIVCEGSDRPCVYHVGTLGVNDIFQTETNISDMFQKPKPLAFNSWTDVGEYVKQLDPKKLQGVVGFSSTGAEVKIVSSVYQKFFNVRGNESNLKYRYLQLRSKPDLMQTFLELYSDKMSTFVEIEQTIASLAMMIHQAYIMRFINKQYVVVPKEQYKIIQECHSFYMSDRVKNRITPQVLTWIMSKESLVPTLFSMLRQQQKK